MVTLRSPDDLIDHYLSHHRALGHSPRTVDHYQDTLKDLHRFLADQRLPHDQSELTNQMMFRSLEKTVNVFTYFDTRPLAAPLAGPGIGIRQTYRLRHRPDIA
jgi:hypothetical protein